MVDECLQSPPVGIEEAVPGEKVVIDHLAGQAALEVEDDGDVQRLAHGATDERALVQVGVDDMWALAAGLAQYGGSQQGIEGDFVARRSDLDSLPPGNG